MDNSVAVKNNYRKFLLLWSGELISSIGGGLSSFGLGIYIYQQTGSAAGMSFMTLLAFLPGLLLKVPAGVLADRYDRRLLMMIGDGLSGLGVLYILICMMTGKCQIWQIYVGVTISSVFSALLEPAFTATITDLLTKEQYSKANGLVSLAGSARYLFSPVIAGFLLAVSDIKLILIIDICTFFLTVVCAAVVRKGLATKVTENKDPFMKSMKDGWKAVAGIRGLLLLVIVSSFLTLFIGFFQVLAEPFVLSFSDPKTVGIVETVCASGMLAGGLLLGIFGIKKNFARILSISLILSGIGMTGFGLFHNFYVISIFGFMFFLGMAYANNSLDYLVRTNIPDELQGRAWGFIGLISQMGYVVAYLFSGLLADGIGHITERGSGFGSSVLIIVSGIGLAAISFVLLFIKSIRQLEYADKKENICLES
ncbi:MAG: MFS transporter [Clostridiales bacterium]|nr:MFS transporter [Clostridiales bacterium]